MQDNNSKHGPPLVVVVAALLLLALVVRARWALIDRMAQMAPWVALIALGVVVVALAVRVALLPSPARRNYVLAWLARVGWRSLTRNLNLAHVDQHQGDSGKRKVRHPTVRIRADEFGIVATVKTVPKSGRAEFEAASLHIGNAWRVHRVQVSQPRPGRLIVRGLRTDPLAARFGLEGVPPDAFGNPARPYLGISEFAEHRYLDLAGHTAVVIGGIPGRGKSSLIGSLLYQWAPSPAVALVTLDGKGSFDLSDFHDRCWLHCGDSLEDAVSVLEDVHAEMRRRLACVLERTGYRNAWRAGASESWPMLVTVLDECQFFCDVASYKGDREREALARRCVALLGEIIRKGRSVMLVTVLATQKPTSDSLPSQLSSNAGISLCFGVKTIDAAAAVLGPDIREYGSVSPVGLRDDSMVGVLTSTLATGQDPFTRVRVPGFSEAEIAERAAATAHLRADLSVARSIALSPAIDLPLPADVAA